MARSRQTGRELYPGSSEADELIYANALLPLSKIPGQLADTMYRQRMAALAESEFAEKRRTAKRDEFMDYMGAAKGAEDRSYGSTGGVPGTARAPTGATGAGATGRGGAPSYSVVMDPVSGKQVVSGMEFGPGSDLSPDDLTAQMFLPDRAQVATGLEAQRAEGEQILAAHRASELAAGAAPTAEERSQQLIGELGLRGPGELGGLSERQALAMSERELAGKETPVLDRLLTQAGVDLGERPRTGQAYEKPPPADISEAIQRAMDAPEDPYRELSEGYISWDEAKALEGSEVMSGVVGGDYLGGKTGKRVMERRAYERYLRATGETEAAQVLEETRKVAWAQEAREKEAFMNAMVPELNKAKMADAQAAASLWWDEPEAAGKMYAGAVSIMKSHIANIPQLRRLHNDMQHAKKLGKERADLIKALADKDFRGGAGQLLSIIDQKESDARGDIETASGSWRAFADKHLRSEAGRASLEVLASFDVDSQGLPGGATQERRDRWVASALSGNDRRIRDLVMSDIALVAGDRNILDRRGGYAVGSGLERYGLTDETDYTAIKRALYGHTVVDEATGERVVRGGERQAQALLDDLHRDRLLIEAEVAAAESGERADKVTVSNRRQLGLPGRGPAGVAGQGWHYAGSGGAENEMDSLSSGGTLSFEVGDVNAADLIGAPTFWERVATAATRGEIVESSVYMGRQDPEAPRAQTRRGPKMPPGTEAEVDYLIEKLVGDGVPRPVAEAQARTFAIRDPDGFARAVRARSPKGKGPRVSGPLERTGGGEEGVAFAGDTNIYPDEWMQKAHGEGMRRVDEGEIMSGSPTGGWVTPDGMAVPEATVRSSHGG